MALGAYRTSQLACPTIFDNRMEAAMEIKAAVGVSSGFIFLHLPGAGESVVASLLKC